MFSIRKRDGFGGALQDGRRLVNGGFRIGRWIAAKMKMGPKGRNRYGTATIRHRGCLERPKRARNGVWTGFGGKIWPKTGSETAKFAKNAKKRAENGIKTEDLAGKQEISGKHEGRGRKLRKMRKTRKMGLKWLKNGHFYIFLGLESRLRQGFCGQAQLVAFGRT